VGGGPLVAAHLAVPWSGNTHEMDVGSARERAPGAEAQQDCHVQFTGLQRVHEAEIRDAELPIGEPPRLEIRIPCSQLAREFPGRARDSLLQFWVIGELLQAAVRFSRRRLSKSAREGRLRVLDSPAFAHHSPQLIALALLWESARGRSYDQLRIARALPEMQAPSVH
jgi:hypothetical protein